MSAEDNREQIEAAQAGTELQTVEKTSEYQAALEHEKEGYQSRLAALKVGKQDPASADRLQELVAGVDAELARLTKGSTSKPKTAPKPKTASKPKTAPKRKAAPKSSAVAKLGSAIKGKAAAANDKKQPAKES